MAKLSSKTAATVLDATDDMPITQDTGTTPVSKRSALSLIRDWITSNATRLSVASGTITASAPVTLTQTWNSGAVTFKGLDINVTDTASTAASLLADFRSGGTSFAGIRKDGYSYSTLSKSSVSLEVFSSAAEVRSRSGARGFTASNTVISLLSTVPLSWSSGTASFSVGDTNLYRDAAGQLALRNTTNAQSLAVYNTWTDASNYERLRIYGTAASAFTIASEAAGTGTVRDLTFLNTDTYFDVYNSSGFGPTTVWRRSRGSAGSPSAVANNDALGFFAFRGRHSSGWPSSSSAYIQATATEAFTSGAIGGKLVFATITNGTSTNAIRLTINHNGLIGIGPDMTSSSPAIKRSGITLQARLADDSGYATYQGKLRTDANAVSEAIVPTHTLTLYDAAGTAYKVAVQAA